MAEKMKQETIDRLVQSAHTQAAYLIETVLRQTVADFEASNNEGFKLTMTIEGERNGADATLTLQSNGVSSVNLKRKDQTPAIVIDYGPSLFDQKAEATVEAEAPKGKRGRKLLKAATKLLKAADGDEPIEGEVVDGGDEDGADKA